MPLRAFKRGDVIWWKFPSSPIQPDYTIRGRHMAVILSDDTLENRTVIVSPISSWVKKNKDGSILVDEQGNPLYKTLKGFHLELPRSTYPHFLQHDSYLKLDQLFTLTRDTIHGRIIGSLSSEDLFQLDLKIMQVLAMFDTVEMLVDAYHKQMIASENSEPIVKR